MPASPGRRQAAISFAIGAEQEEGSKHPDAFAYLLGVAIAAPLLVRRRWPLGVLLASTGVAMIYHALDYPAIGLALPLAVALYTAAAAGYLVPAAIVMLGLHVGAAWYRAVEEDKPLVQVIGSGTIDQVLAAEPEELLRPLGDADAEHRHAEVHAPRLEPGQGQRAAVASSLRHGNARSRPLGRGQPASTGGSAT